MNSKILGVIPLMVAMLFVVAFAVGDNQVSAVDYATQTVTVNVPEAISLTVPDISIPGPTALQVATGVNSTQTYSISNTGNVKIDVFARAGSNAFTKGSGDTIPIAGNYFIKQNQTGSFAQLDTAAAGVLIYDNFNKASQSTGTPNVWSNAEQSLYIPAFTEDGNYANTVIYSAQKH